MTDHSSTIVNLAREILRRDDFTQHARTLVRPSAWRTVALASLLTTDDKADVVRKAAWSRPLNRYERIELIALIAYTARLQQLDIEDVRDGFYHDFAITSLDDLSRDDLNRARIYLQTRLCRGH